MVCRVRAAQPFSLIQFAMKITLSRIISLIISTSAVVLVSGCGPRGESHTIEQIFSDARAAYSKMASKATPDMNATLTGIVGSLDKIARQGGGDVRQLSAAIADGLTAMLPKVGFTQRPAMTELIKQYRQIAEGTGAHLTSGAPNLKLVAARTYSILSAEITSTNFRIS
ncbi:MAG: hypothetical protein RIS36_2387 [Pseudomonadota bacterium]